MQQQQQQQQQQSSWHTAMLGAAAGSWAAAAALLLQQQFLADVACVWECCKVPAVVGYMSEAARYSARPLAILQGHVFT
jgi:hypothetical protein